MGKKKQMDIPGTERTAHPEIEEAALELREIRAERMRLTEKEGEAAARLMARMEAASLTTYELDAKDDDGETPLIAELVHTDVKPKVRRKDARKKQQEKPATSKVAPQPEATAKPAPSEQPSPAGDVLVRVQDGRGNLVDCPVEKCGARAMRHCRDARGEEARGQCHAARLQAAAAEIEELKTGQEEDRREVAEEAQAMREEGKVDDAGAAAVGGEDDEKTRGREFYEEIGHKTPTVDEDEPDGEPAPGGATRTAKPRGRAASRKMAN